MMRIRIRVMRRIVAYAAGLGILSQVACPATIPGIPTPSAQDLQAIVGAVVQTSAAVIADTVFFFLDNFLVRLTG